MDPEYDVEEDSNARSNSFLNNLLYFCVEGEIDKIGLDLSQRFVLEGEQDGTTDDDIEI